MYEILCIRKRLFFISANVSVLLCDFFINILKAVFRYDEARRWFVFIECRLIWQTLSLCISCCILNLCFKRIDKQRKNYTMVLDEGLELVLYHVII